MHSPLMLYRETRTGVARALVKGIFPELVQENSCVSHPLCGVHVYGQLPGWKERQAERGFVGRNRASELLRGACGDT